MFFFWDAYFKIVKDKALCFLLVENMGKDFSCTKI